MGPSLLSSVPQMPQDSRYGTHGSTPIGTTQIPWCLGTYTRGLSHTWTLRTGVPSSCSLSLLAFSFALSHSGHSHKTKPHLRSPPSLTREAEQQRYNRVGFPMTSQDVPRPVGDEIPNPNKPPISFPSLVRPCKIRRKAKYQDGRDHLAAT